MTLTVSGLSRSYGHVPVLREVSFSVGEGERAALVGASGSGKSTLLRLVAGFDRPGAGSVALAGTTLVDDRSSVPAHRRGIGYVAQDGALFPHLTVRQNVAFGLPRDRDRDARVLETLDLVGLDTALVDRYPHALSGGQQQRVALARALAPRPRAILLDEPFSALDTGLREQTRRAVVDALEQAKVTAVLVTHDQEEALSFGHAVGVLADGVLLQWGEPAAVFDDPTTPSVAAFLGAALLLPATRSGGTVECAFGRVEVRHDHAPVDGGVCAMVRPAQVSLMLEGSRPDQAPGHPTPVAGSNATLQAVTARGAETEVVLVCDDPRQRPLALRLPTHSLLGARPGDRVVATVTGGAVVYPVTAPPT